MKKLISLFLLSLTSQVCFASATQTQQIISRSLQNQRVAAQNINTYQLHQKVEELSQQFNQAFAQLPNGSEKEIIEKLANTYLVQNFNPIGYTQGTDSTIPNTTNSRGDAVSDTICQVIKNLTSPTALICVASVVSLLIFKNTLETGEVYRIIHEIHRIQWLSLFRNMLSWVVGIIMTPIQFIKG
jgi:hypothetical protein